MEEAPLWEGEVDGTSCRIIPLDDDDCLVEGLVHGEWETVDDALAFNVMCRAYMELRKRHAGVT